MTPGKWFRKSKAKKEETQGAIDIEGSEQEMASYREPMISSPSQEKPVETPVLEYRETLYSQESEKKPITSKPLKEPLKRRGWENPTTIERNVDEIKKKSGEKNQKSRLSIEDKVDLILKKKKQ